MMTFIDVLSATQWNNDLSEMRQYKQAHNNFPFFSFQSPITKEESWYKSWRGWYNAGRKCRNDWTDRYSGRISQVSYLPF